MSSHHFLGTGALSGALRDAAEAPDELVERVAELVEASGLSVVTRQAVPFAGGGMTLVWVLAESHLVLHHWGAEGFATVDLHVCDYNRSNAERAGRLRERLDAFCFSPGSSGWQELHLPHPGET